MTNKPTFKPRNSASLKFGDEILNGNIHWRHTLLELLLHSDYSLNNISDVLGCSLSALMLVVNHNDSSFISFKQGARLLTLHDKAVNCKKYE